MTHSAYGMANVSCNIADRAGYDHDFSTVMLPVHAADIIDVITTGEIIRGETYM